MEYNSSEIYTYFEIPADQTAKDFWFNLVFLWRLNLGVLKLVETIQMQACAKSMCN